MLAKINNLLEQLKLIRQVEERKQMEKLEDEGRCLLHKVQPSKLRLQKTIQRGQEQYHHSSGRY